MKLPLFLGKLVYITAWIPIRFMLVGSNRVYLLLEVENKTLVTKNWLGLHLRWRLPGGGLKHDESVQSGLIRECQEELGFDISLYSPQILTDATIKSPAGYSYIIYRLRLPDFPVIYPNNNEIAEFDWINIKDLPDSLCSEELRFIRQTLL